MSSTIWNSSPSSSPNARHGVWSRSPTPATQSAIPTEAAKRRPVLSLCSVSSSGAESVTSRYCPPIMPSVAWASSRPTCGHGYESASRNASASKASPARTATASPYWAQTDGRPRRSASLSRDGRSSWTSENACTSSSDAAAGSPASASPPAASTVARQITARTRLPPSSAYRTASACPWSSGVRARSPRYPSASARSRSGLCTGIRLALGLLELLFDRLAELGELRQNVEGLVSVVGLGETFELCPSLLEASQQLLGPREGLFGAHDTRSLTIRPRMPFTKRAASSVA